eukprot:UN04792
MKISIGKMFTVKDLVFCQILSPPILLNKSRELRRIRINLTSGFEEIHSPTLGRYHR